MTTQKLFDKIYGCSTEEELHDFVEAHQLFENSNWFPLGGNDNNYGVIENQQSNPIAALIEKLTNSIDAILMKRCLEKNIDPKSQGAPKSMDEAVEVFFDDASSWDLNSFRRSQSENIQIIADGPRKNTSLVIYDNGEGQHPDNFENSFLSLLKGNKNEIQFVQGKYNMGGSGAIVFCGKKSYQLIASKRFDKSGNFGFTLIREHPLSAEEKVTKKNTWYEFLKIDEKIPEFPITKLDVGLHNRSFETGTLIKLYSYDLPSGSRSVISRDLNQSINEFLFKPALPMLTVDNKARYPDDRNLERPLFGLKRRLEQDDKKYIEDYFSETFSDEMFGQNGFIKITCYVFKVKIEGKTVKETKDTISREFFKNNMSVLFSVNGQVHGNYTSEFMSRSLKMSLIKDYLLIHIDCTNVDVDFRKELFMASRDRLKDGAETRELRKYLASKLSAKGSRLSNIYNKRKNSISFEESDTKDLLKSFTKDLPLNSDLMKLLSKTFKLDSKDDEKKKKGNEKPNPKKQFKEKEPFKPQRFPTFFKAKLAERNGIRAIQIPKGSDKIIKFDTDVENNYFDRIDEPGKLKIALLSIKRNDESGGEKGESLAIEDVMNVHVSSPEEGTIRLGMNNKTDVKVGDEMEVSVTLDGPGQDFNEIFWAKITEPEKPTEKVKEKEEEELQGLPEVVLVNQTLEDGTKGTTWEDLSNIGIEMDYDKIMHPFTEGDGLEKVYINMDSSLFKNFLSKQRNINEEQLQISERKYISSVFFHVIFLFTISKNKGYQFQKAEGETYAEKELGDYLIDLFDNHYASFLLNFGGADQLLQGMG